MANADEFQDIHKKKFKKREREILLVTIRVKLWLVVLSQTKISS